MKTAAAAAAALTAEWMTGAGNRRHAAGPVYRPTAAVPTADWLAPGRWNS